MDERIFRDMVRLQREHWWFRGKRDILGYLLGHLSLPPADRTRVLEIGCGTGGNLDMLKAFGKVSAVEIDPFAIESAKSVPDVAVEKGSLPDDIPFEGGFDLVCLFDVLEHVEDDRAALSAIRRLLNPGGICALTVPACQWLYGRHDRIHHHFRRYNRKGLEQMIASSGMRVVASSYFNTFLFPVAIVTRIADKFTDFRESLGYTIPPGPFNKLLYAIFHNEKYFIRRFGFPIGASVIVVCELPSDISEV